MKSQKFLTTKTLTSDHPLLLQNALKLTYSKVKNQITSGGNTPEPPASEEGGMEGGESEWKERVWAPHFFIQVYACL